MPARASVIDRLHPMDLQERTRMDTIWLRSPPLERARANTEKPTFIEIKTTIAKGIPEVAVPLPDMVRVGQNLPKLPVRVSTARGNFCFRRGA